MNARTQQLIGQAQQRYAQLSERERRIVLLGAVAAAILILVATLLPLQRSVAAVEQRVDRKRDDLSFLRSVAPQLAGLRASAAPQLHESLVSLVDRTAREAGMQKSLAGNQPNGDGGLSVRFDQIPFDTLVTWLSQLHDRYGVRADSATIEVGNAVGTVNATLTLRAG